MRISDWSSDVCSSDLVEGEEEQLGLLVLCAMATLQHRLQRREIGVAVLAIGDDLAVDQAGRQVERGDVADERREFVGPVEAIAGVEAHVAARGRRWGAERRGGRRGGKRAGRTG